MQRIAMNNGMTTVEMALEMGFTDAYGWFLALKNDDKPKYHQSYLRRKRS